MCPEWLDDVCFKRPSGVGMPPMSIGAQQARVGWPFRAHFDMGAELLAMATDPWRTPVRSIDAG